MEDYNNPKREQEATIQIGNGNATALNEKTTCTTTTDSKAVSENC